MDVQAMHHFGSIEELVHAADYARKYKIKCENWCKADWVGRRFYSWEDTKAAAEQPWELGLKTLAEIERQIEKMLVPDPVVRRRKPTWGNDTGDEVSVDRLRNGEDFWLSMQKQPTVATKTCTLVIDPLVNHTMDWSIPMYRGAAAIALTDRLESHGYRVEIIAAVASANCYAATKETAYQSVEIKPADHPLDRCSLVNILSGWFMRAIWLQAFEAYRKCRRGKGRSLKIGKTDFQLQKVAGVDPILIGWDIYSISTAVEAIEAELKKLETC